MMNESDKQQLIKLASKMFCTECGKREHEYVELDRIEQVNGTSIIIPNVPTMRCKTCGSVSYPSFSYDIIRQYKEEHWSH